MLTIPVAHKLTSATFYLLTGYSWSAQLNLHSGNYPGHPCLLLWNSTTIGFHSLSACTQAPKGILCAVMLCLFALLFLLQPISPFSHFFHYELNWEEHASHSLCTLSFHKFHIWRFFQHDAICIFVICCMLHTALSVLSNEVPRGREPLIHPCREL